MWESITPHSIDTIYGFFSTVKRISAVKNLILTCFRTEDQSRISMMLFSGSSYFYFELFIYFPLICYRQE